MTWRGERFKGKIGLTIEDSIPAWPEAPVPSEGAPNIIYSVLGAVRQ